MKPYPKNNIDYKPVNPIYVKNDTEFKESRYSTYRVVDNLPNDALEVKLTNSISQNKNIYELHWRTLKKYNSK